MMYRWSKAQIGLYCLLAGVLYSGCQESSTTASSDRTLQISLEQKAQTTVSKDFVDYLREIQVPVLQTRSIEYRDFFDKNAPSLIALVDGESLHLNGQYIGWEIPDIISYCWSDMHGNILSETSQLDRTLYYDSRYDCEQRGYVNYAQTIHVRNATGESDAKRFDVHVYAKPFARGRVFAQYGPIAGAYFTLYHFGQSEIVADGVTIFGEWGDLNSSGWLNIDPGLVQDLDAGYYTLQVAYGEDVDYDHDGIWDVVPTPVRNPFHTIVWQHDLAEGGYHVTLLGEIYYQAYEAYRKDFEVPESAVRQLFDESAAEVLREDVDGDGDIDYADILRWDPTTDMDKLTTEFKEEIQLFGQWVYAIQG